MGSTVGFTSKMGFGSTGLALGPSFSHCNTVGQELSPTNSLFSIRSYTMKSLGGTGKREVTGTIHKKNKQGRKGARKENFLQEERGHINEVKEIHDIRKVTEEN